MQGADLPAMRCALRTGLASPLALARRADSAVDGGAAQTTALHAACLVAAPAADTDALSMLLAFAAHRTLQQKGQQSLAAQAATVLAGGEVGRLPALALLPDGGSRLTVLQLADSMRCGLEVRLTMRNAFVADDASGGIGGGGASGAGSAARAAAAATAEAEGRPQHEFVAARGSAQVAAGGDVAAGLEPAGRVPWGVAGGGGGGAAERQQSGPPRLSYLRRCVEGEGVRVDWKFEKPLAAQLKPCSCGGGGGGKGAAAARCGAACSNRHGAPVGALYECHALCVCRGNCGLRATQRGGSLGSAALAVRLTEHCGWGLFAAAAIGADEFVVEYTGEIVTKAAAEAREAGYQAAGLASYIFNLASVMSCQLGSASAVVIDSTHAGNVASFANHACKGANLVAKRVFVNHRDRAFPRVCFFTVRAVAAGEELTLNYGDAPAPCHCGSCSGGAAGAE